MGTMGKRHQREWEQGMHSSDPAQGPLGRDQSEWIQCPHEIIGTVARQKQLQWGEGAKAEHNSFRKAASML